MERANQQQEEEEHLSTNFSGYDLPNQPNEQPQQQQQQQQKHRQLQQQQLQNQEAEQQEREQLENQTEQQHLDYHTVPSVDADEHSEEQRGPSRMEHQYPPEGQEQELSQQPQGLEETRSSQELSLETDGSLEEKPPDSSQGQEAEEEPPPYSPVDPQLNCQQQQLLQQPLHPRNILQQQQFLYRENQLPQQLQQLQQRIQDQQHRDQQEQQEHRQSPQQSPFRVLQPPRSIQSRDWSQSFQESVHRLQIGIRRGSKTRAIVFFGVCGVLTITMGFNLIFLNFHHKEEGISVVLVIGVIFLIFGVVISVRMCFIMRTEDAFTPIDDSNGDGLDSGSYADVLSMSSLPTYSAFPQRAGGNYQLIPGVPAETYYGYPDDDRPPAYSDIFKDT